MPYSTEIVDEINVLMLFNLDTLQEGIKVHHDAEPEKISATERLFEKGLISQKDGGYLTELGRQTAEHAQSLLTVLRTG